MSYFHVSFPGLGIENITIKREIFTIFGISIYWYGLLIAMAVLLSLYLSVRDSRKFGLVQDDVLDTFLILIPAIIIFARLYYVIFSWADYKDNLAAIFDTRRGGLAFYGGVIGGVLAFALVCKLKKKKIVNWLDFFVVYLPLGQAIGRWGNFFNQEAFGINTDLPWGMISEGTVSYLKFLQDPNVNPFLPVHPTFLYEFIGNMLIFAILYYVRNNSVFHLEGVAWYFMSYGCLRFFVESIRTDALFIGSTNIRVSMLLSFIMFVLGIAYLIYGYIANRKNRLPKCLVKVWQPCQEANVEGVIANEEVSVTAITEIDAEVEAEADAQTDAQVEAGDEER